MTWICSLARGIPIHSALVLQRTQNQHNALVQNKLQYVNSSDTFAFLMKLYQFCCNWSSYILHHNLCLCCCSVHVVINDDNDVRVNGILNLIRM